MCCAQRLHGLSLEHAEHKARAAACGAELLMQEERDKWEKHLAAERAAARSRERGHAQALERLKSQHWHLAEMAQHEVAQRDAEAAQRKAMEAEKAAATVQLTAEAEAKCAAKLEEMSERLDALQICMDAEAARADAASARRRKWRRGVHRRPRPSSHEKRRLMWRRRSRS